MSTFYNLFSVGLHPQNDERVPVTWSEPYFGFTLGSREIAASAPVYDMTVQPPRLLGVIFIDFGVDELEKFAPLNQITQKLAFRAKKCPTFNATWDFFVFVCNNMNHVRNIC